MAGITPNFLGGSSNILGGSETISILAAGRGIMGIKGIGLSASARSINEKLVNSSQQGLNSLLSLAAGPDATVDGAKQQILALRAGLSDRQLAPSLRSTATDNGNAAADPSKGTSVDTTA
jgi:hypothetical protein